MDWFLLKCTQSKKCKRGVLSCRGHLQQANRRYVYMLLATLLLMLLSVAEVVSLGALYPSSVLSQTKSTLLPRSGKLIWIIHDLQDQFFDDPIGVALAIFVVAIFAKGVFLWMQWSFKIGANLSDKAFENILRQDVLFHSQREIGSAINTASTRLT